MQQGTSIHPEIAQDLFDSATNASAKGQAQFFTPVAWARELAAGLPDCRPTIADLTCGNGQLLLGASNAETKHLLGAELEPVRNAPGASVQRIQADLTRLYPLLVETDWQADLFVLNPPWDLHWHKERLALLAESDLVSVRDAFNARDPRLGEGQIDSTIGTLLIALDRCTYRGEGFLIANDATLERLLFGPNAPHAALVQHIWHRAVYEGNRVTGEDRIGFDHRASEFKTGVIYFSRSHEVGPGRVGEVNRYTHRGSEVRWNDHARGDTALVWAAVREEWRRQQGQKVAHPYNLWLQDGTIHTQLSTFQEHSSKVDKRTARELHELNGRRPMELVLQRNTRDLLFRMVEGTDLPWRVDPALAEAVRQAHQQYEAQRAPLYPLPKIQRLGYLEEEDTILALEDFEVDGVRRFERGQRYPLRTKTITVKRQGQKLNLVGETEELEFSGQELATFITDGQDQEHCFLDPRALAPGVELPPLFSRSEEGLPAEARVHSLTALADHFEIPEVPDVASANPEGYGLALSRLQELQQFGELKLKRFQLEDLSRASLHDGLILGWATGLGKTLAGFLWPLLKLGYDVEDCPAPTPRDDCSSSR